MPRTDLDQPYLTSQLLAYIGNKRALLPWLAGLLEELSPGAGPLVDPFCGTGSVARLGRVLGRPVFANDWEPYASTVTRAHTQWTPAEAEAACAPWGGPEALAAWLGRPAEPGEDGPAYFARHYAPAQTEAADYRRERLFYTAENGAFLDRVRARLDRLWPGAETAEGLPPPGPAQDLKVYWLAALATQASVHSNTSGVFKAYHKGFGGHGGDALTRILKPMALQAPLCVQGPATVVSALDAAAFVAQVSSPEGGAVLYLDPPYNQHQYGSNYHLLNTVVLGDRPPVSGTLGADGRLRAKAGIRADWVQRRSPYCSRSTALPSLLKLLDANRCPLVLLSYNTEGIIPLPELCSALGRRGSVDLRLSPYVTYRGGRQSPGRQIHNAELVLVFRPRRPPQGPGLDLERLLLRRRISALWPRTVDPEAWARVCADPVSADLLRRAGARVDAQRLTLPAAGPRWEGLAEGEESSLAPALAAALCQDHRQEAEVLRRRLAGTAGRGRRSLETRLLRVLRKFAFKKYRSDFEAAWHACRAEASGPFAAELDGLSQLALRRFSG